MKEGGAFDRMVHNRVYGSLCSLYDCKNLLYDMEI